MSNQHMLRLVVVALAFAQAAGPEILSDENLAAATAIGRGCQAPIIKVSDDRGDFDVYIETPTGRAALVAATAVVMHQPLDGLHVRRAIEPGYRIWVQRKDNSWRPLTVRSVAVRSGGATIRPVSVRNVRFFLGSVPSHGIIEPLRTRFPESRFDRLPGGAFEVIVETDKNVQRYRVAAADRAAVMRVCN